MATFVEAVGWFLIACGVATLIVPMVIRIPDPVVTSARKTIWARIRDAATLVGLGLLTLFFPVRVHVIVFVVMVIAGRVIHSIRRAGSTARGWAD